MKIIPKTKFMIGEMVIPSKFVDIDGCNYNDIMNYLNGTKSKIKSKAITKEGIKIYQLENGFWWPKYALSYENNSKQSN